jgi:hypothetical protein
MARRQLPGYGAPPARARERQRVMHGCSGCRGRTAGVGRLRRPVQAHSACSSANRRCRTQAVQHCRRATDAPCGCAWERCGWGSEAQPVSVGAQRVWVGALLLRLDAQPLRLGGTATEVDGAAPVARSARAASPGATAGPRSAAGVTPSSGECAAPHPVPLPQGERAPPPGPLFARRLASRENSFSPYLIPFQTLPQSPPPARLPPVLGFADRRGISPDREP